MRLDRVIARLGGIITMLVAACALYGVAGFVLGFVPGVELEPDQSLPWPTVLPPWLLVALAFAALVVTAIQMPLIVVARSRRRTLARRLGAEADQWMQDAGAATAAGSGQAFLAVTGFRAHARGSSGVELSWNPPSPVVDEVVVLRSRDAFPASAAMQDGQVVVYSGDEAACLDAELDDGCVYHYAAFGRGRDGGWSVPAWAWAATPPLPLHTKLLSSLRMSRTWLYPWRP